MPLLGEQLRVTELDFASIRENLKEYFKRDGSAFTDWDFEGSNLSNILDLLAYNTHYNAMLAHLAVNESFIDSAQLRPSIVSAAKLLGYTPRSMVSAKADLYGSLTINASDAPETLVIPKGTRFSATGANGYFTFVALGGGVTATKSGNVYVIPRESPLTVNQGRLVQTSYEAAGNDPNQRYEILDENIDVGTLRVLVYPTSSRSEGTPTVFQLSTTLDIGADTPVYFLSENLYGRYELSFGDGVFGRKLQPGEVIDVEYLVTDGPSANGINSPFALSSTLPGVAPGAALSIASGRTSSGAKKESNEALKTNAINSFSTQNRAVTADDYKSLILKRFGGAGGISSVSVWGGEDNDPPEYGKAFISLQSSAGDSPGDASDGLKNDILSYLSSKKILSITPEIVDSKSVNIVLDILVKYDPNISSKTSTQLVQSLRSVVNDYNTNILSSSFDVVFRHSNFMKRVDSSDRSIMNSTVRVYVAQNLVIPPRQDNRAGNFDIDFGAPLKSDDGRVIVSSGSWIDSGRTLYLTDYETSVKNIRDVHANYYFNGVEIVGEKVGTIDLSKGLMSLSRIYSDDLTSFTTVKILANTQSNDIVGSRNKILRIDEVSTSVVAEPDEIAAGGSSRSASYTTFGKDRE